MRKRNESSAVTAIENKRDELGKFKKGSKPWNYKFKKCFSKETLLKMRIKKIGICGSGHSKWKGGKFLNSQGYVLIYSPNHPYKDCRGYVREHRLVMEKQLGRYLKPKEVVHHLNEVKDDNRIENLRFFCSSSKHSKNHFPKGSYFGIHSQKKNRI